MKIHVLRLQPQQRLKEEILQYAKMNKISAGCILTLVGSLSSAVLRLAGGHGKRHFHGKFEIVSFVGTFSENACHFHLCISDQEGQTFGGHLLDGCVVHTTAEIVLAELPGFTFKREHDPNTGYAELKVEKKQE